MDDVTKRMKRLIEAFGPSGFEQDATKAMKQWIGPGPEFRGDKLGSLIAKRTGSDSQPRILIAGHLDEIGFMITGILPEGYLKFAPLGGWSPQVALGMMVEVRTRAGRRIPGVIWSEQAPPGKPTTDLKLDQLYIDLGTAIPFIAEGAPKPDPDKKEKNLAERLGIRIGDPVIPRGGFEVLEEGSVYLGRCWDNRIGCAVAAEVMRRLCAEDIAHPNTVFCAGTVQEEVGLRGAGTVAWTVEPDLAIAVDITSASDSPAYMNPANPRNKLGWGASICTMDGNNIANPRLRDYLIELAEAEGLRWHLNMIQFGSTDAGPFGRSRSGAPSLYLGIPSRYGHSPHTMISRADFDAAVGLCLALVRKFDRKALAKLLG